MSVPSISDPARGDVVQAWNQARQRGLARPGGSDDREGLARAYLEPDIAEHVGVTVGEAEPDTLEAQVPGGTLDLASSAADRGLGVEHLHHSVGRRHRLLRHRQDVTERRDRPDQLQHQGGERDQRAQCQRTLPDRQRTEEQHEGERDVGYEAEDGPEPGGEPHLLHRGGVHLARALVEVVVDVVPTAERLDHPDADGTLLDDGREVALLVLDCPGDPDVAALELQRRVDDRYCRGRDDQAQWPVHLEQQHRHDAELDDVGDEEQDAEAEEPADHREVGGRPGQQLATLPTAVERHRQALQVGVEVVPDRSLQAEYGPRLDPATEEDQERFGDAEQYGQQAEQDEPSLVSVGDRSVDDLLGDQRNGQARTDADECGDEHQDQAAGVRAKVRTEPPQRVEAGERTMVGWLGLVFRTFLVVGAGRRAI